MTMTISRQQATVTTAGIIRRVQALTARGWAYPEVDSWLDARPGTARRIAEFEFPQLSTADVEDIARVYSYVEDRDPASRPLEESKLAELRQWIAPEYWVGVDIDNPLAFPVERASETDMWIARDALLSGHPEVAHRVITNREDRAELAWRMERDGVPHATIGRICGRGDAVNGTTALLAYREYCRGRRARLDSDRSRLRMVATGHVGVTLADHGAEVWRILAEVTDYRRPVEAFTTTDEGGFSATAGTLASRLFGWNHRVITVDWLAECGDRCPRDPWGNSRHRFGGRCAMANEYALQHEMDAMFAVQEEDLGIRPKVLCGHLHKTMSRTARVAKYGRALGIDVTAVTIDKGFYGRKAGVQDCT